MPKLSKRQLSVLNFIQNKGMAGNQEIRSALEDVSRATINRDLEALLKMGLIQQKGQGRNVCYQEKVKTPILRYIDAEQYFKKGPDDRDLEYEKFNFKVFENLRDIFSAEELAGLKAKNELYQKRIKRLSPSILKKEIERLTIELSWKSSQIEGNTYSLLDTEALIKENREAAGHSREEASMILNHKYALEYIFKSSNAFRTITLRQIRSIHDLIVKGLPIGRGIRKRPVGIVGTRYRPLDNEHQINEALQKTVSMLKKFKDPFSEAIAAMAMISYIQPFEDGNKRTARLLGNAILIGHKACPVSFRSVNEVEYKKAVILWYEQNNIGLFKKIFIEQFNFAVDNYFLV